MEKLSGLSAYLLLQGLKLAAQELKTSIALADGIGEFAIMTPGYVDTITKETRSWIIKHTNEKPEPV